jgi:two-component system response regulator PilR (NtrC family)
VPGGRLLLIAEGTTRGQLAPPQPLLEQFLDMAAGLLGALAAREAAAIEPMREELWRDLLGSPAIVGVSPAATALRAALPAAANSSEPLFIGGEPGSGRRSLAATVHRAGPHAGGPFIAEQIAAIPEHLRLSQLFGTDRAPGLAASAAGGTLYLADVDHLPSECQERLLHHLAAGPDNGAAAARIVSSADVDLDQLVRRGRFRRDLAERLTGLRITIAPLRQRPEDIPLIAAQLVRRRAMASGTAVPTILAEALDALKSHPWAGNVRELDEALARAGAGRRLIHAEDLPETIAGARREPDAAAGSSLRSAVSELEVGLISRALDDTNWNKSRAARFLGLSRLGLQKKIDRYGIDRRR